MVLNDLTHHKCQKLFGKLRIQPRRLRQRTQAADLLRLACRIGRRQAKPSLQQADLLGAFEALRQQVDQRGIDIVDAPAQDQELIGEAWWVPIPR